MKCCGSCFADRFLNDEIARLSKEKGKCDSCGKTDTPLVNAQILADAFELVCEIYEPDASGKKLIDWLIDDWKLFAVDCCVAVDLLGKILDDEERARQPCRPSDLCITDNLDVWESLRTELRTQNRFFPHTEFNTGRVGELLSYLTIPEEKIQQIWHRARIEDSGKQFSPEEMGAPPSEKASPGRANSVGIPYLYVGSKPITAITEVRPHLGEVLSLAEFTVEKGVNLVDLRNPREQVTPFVMEDLEEVAAMRGDIDFLEKLGQELTNPVLPTSAAIEYIPSQYLCEFIKQAGFDGVVYASSVSEGENLALFFPDKATVAGSTTRVKIDSVDIQYDDIA